MNIRRLARGRACSVMLPGVCNSDPETTVLAHLNGAGMGYKQPDAIACFACSACHSWLDGGYVKNATRKDRDYEHMRAIIKTQKILIEEGVLKW